MLFIRKFIRSGLAAVGFFTLLLVIIVAIFGPLLVPYDPAGQNILQRLLPPLANATEGVHLLGTDALGRDILSRLMIGSRVSLLVGASAVVLSGTVGVVLGLVSGYDDRYVGRVLMGLTDIQLAMPFLVLAIAVVAVLGASLINIIIVLGLANWVQYARIVRSEVLVLRDREFVQAARAYGSSIGRILFRQLLPNVTSSIIVISSLQVAKMILLEASLSFLGLGVPSHIPTWGSMISDGRNYIGNAWWVATMPGVAIFITVVSINLVGDRLRDLLDPRLRQLEH